MAKVSDFLSNRFIITFLSNQNPAFYLIHFFFEYISNPKQKTVVRPYYLSCYDNSPTCETPTVRNKDRERERKREKEKENKNYGIEQATVRYSLRPQGSCPIIHRIFHLCRSRYIAAQGTKKIFAHSRIFMDSCLHQLYVDISVCWNMGHPPRNDQSHGSPRK